LILIRFVKAGWEVVISRFGGKKLKKVKKLLIYFMEVIVSNRGIYYNIETGRKKHGIS